MSAVLGWFLGSDLVYILWICSIVGRVMPSAQNILTSLISALFSHRPTAGPPCALVVNVFWVKRCGDQLFLHEDHLVLGLGPSRPRHRKVAGLQELPQVSWSERGRRGCPVEVIFWLMEDQWRRWSPCFARMEKQLNYKLKFCNRFTAVQHKSQGKNSLGEGALQNKGWNICVPGWNS